MPALRLYGPAAVAHHITPGAGRAVASSRLALHLATCSARSVSRKSPRTRVTSFSCLSLSSDEAITEPEFLGGFRGRSPQLVRTEYAELNLKEERVNGGPVRVRQHVNPLRSGLSVPVQPPEWNQVFPDPTLPLMVDIGCGSGRFLLWLAKKSGGTQNFLGLEIREKLVTRAEFWVKELALQNVYFMFANATVSFEHIMATYPGELTLVSILCPDPYLKKRHHKRRVLQKSLVNSIVKYLAPRGQVFMQSDLLEIAVHMRDYFDALSDMLEPVICIDDHMSCDSEGWLLKNPMGIRTEREIHAELEGAIVYRRMYQKKVSTSA